MAKTTKDTAKEWIEGLRELSKELMDDSKEHRKEANEHKKQANTLNQIEDGNITAKINIKFNEKDLNDYTFDVDARVRDAKLNILNERFMAIHKSNL